MILRYTITDEELQHGIKIACSSGMIGACMKLTAFDGRETMLWADILKTVHPTIEENMYFVTKEWKDRGQDLADKQPGAECREHSTMPLVIDPISLRLAIASTRPNVMRTMDRRGS